MVSKTPNRDLLPFYRKLGPEFDAFARRGTSLIKAPVRQFLYGFDFYPKEGDRRCRWLQPFGFPLYVPNMFVRLAYGDRIPRNPIPGLAWFWVYVYDAHVEPEYEAEGIMRGIGLPMLDRFASPEVFSLFLDHYPMRKRDPYYFLDKAATYAFLGDFEQAITEVENFRESDNYWRLGRGGVELQEYEIKQWEAAATLESLARAGDHPGMQSQLRQWREENLDRLNIRDIAEPL